MLNNIINTLKRGRPIIILDNLNRENEGDLVASAQTITNGTANFMVKHSSGVICLAITEEQALRLKISLIDSKYHTKDKLATAFCYSLEAKNGIGTGISAMDRAHSIRVAANPNSTSKDIVVPGHIFPLMSRKGGIKEREGHTEASIEICKIADLWSAAAIVEINSENGKMLKGDDLLFFAETYDIPIITTKDIKNIILNNKDIK